LRLICYALRDHPPRLVPASPQRDWMDAFADRHPYRCLPLSIANAHGWEVLCPIALEIEWNGGKAIADLTIHASEPLPDGRRLEDFCRSHFSNGIVTFHLDYIFRTDPGWDLVATGPFNQPKDDIYPLTGITEADWLPYPFTMNWQMRRPGRVRFARDEPFCFLFPVRKQALAGCVPEIRRLTDDPELARQHDLFRDARETFQARLDAGDAEAQRQAWQRHYFLGRHPDGTQIHDHVNRLRLRDPVDRRGAVLPDRTPELIAAGPSERNLAGRMRIDAAGRLERSGETARLHSPAEAARCDILMIERFLSEEDCARLCRGFAGLADRLVQSDRIDPFWNNRFLPLDAILTAAPETGRIMLGAQRRALREIASFYRLARPIYSDLLQIVHWQPGMFMPPHADRANPDGTPHPTPHRDFAGIVYLNDEYDGGELYFTALDRLVSPRRGLFLAFPAGFCHEHAVLRVERGGPRLTMPSFFTFDHAQADPLLHGTMPRESELDIDALARALYTGAAERLARRLN
jgi:hypothetical protein